SYNNERFPCATFRGDALPVAGGVPAAVAVRAGARPRGVGGRTGCLRSAASRTRRNFETRIHWHVALSLPVLGSGDGRAAHPAGRRFRSAHRSAARVGSAAASDRVRARQNGPWLAEPRTSAIIPIPR